MVMIMKMVDNKAQVWNMCFATIQFKMKRPLWLPVVRDIEPKI